MLNSIRPSPDDQWTRWLAARHGEPIQYSLVLCPDGVYRPEPDAVQFAYRVLDECNRRER